MTIQTAAPVRLSRQFLVQQSVLNALKAYYPATLALDGIGSAARRALHWADLNESAFNHEVRDQFRKLVAQ